MFKYYKVRHTYIQMYDTLYQNGFASWAYFALLLSPSPCCEAANILLLCDGVPTLSWPFCQNYDITCHQSG